MHLPHLALLAGLMLAAGQAATAATVVVPGSFAATEGNSSNSAIIGSASRTIQYLYAAADFTLHAGDTLTGMAFRLNGGNSSIPGALTWTQYDVQISTTTTAPGSLSGTFADNDGADAVTVRSGTMSLPASSFTSGQTPNAFGVDISFTNPFVYNGNNLLVTIRTSGDAQSTSASIDTTGSVVGHYQGQGSTVGSSATVANGATTTTAIIRFDVTAVPEPATPAMLAGGTGLLILRRRRRAIGH